MAVKTILTEPNKILRQISQPVEKVGKDEQQLMDDMLETMYAANGIGLAAIQIGIPKRIIVMDISKDENKKEPRYFVNPIIKNKGRYNNKAVEIYGFNPSSVYEENWPLLDKKRNAWNSIRSGEVIFVSEQLSIREKIKLDDFYQI